MSTIAIINNSIDEMPKSCDDCPFRSALPMWYTKGVRVDFCDIDDNPGFSQRSLDESGVDYTKRRPDTCLLVEVPDRADEVTQ
jgi:hypothetical protein